MKARLPQIFCCLLLLVVNEGLGQEAQRSQELTLRTDNDVYTFRDSDKYYSNGLILAYRWVPTKKGFLTPTKRSDSAKLILELGIAHKFFTPKFLENEDVDDFDRPYTGALSASYLINYFPSEHVKWKYGLNTTLVGPATGAGDFQIWYHELFGFPEPRGWDFQVPNELTINLSGEFQRQVPLTTTSLDLISTSSLMLGTGFTNAKQQFDLRIGRFASLNESAYARSVIGKSSQTAGKEFFLFVGAGLEYVVQNITIQGSIWNDKAPHTEVITPWVMHFRTGLVTGNAKSTFRLVYHWLSSEVRQVGWHSYIGIELNLRFASAKEKRKASNRQTNK